MFTPLIYYSALCPYCFFFAFRSSALSFLNFTKANNFGKVCGDTTISNFTCLTLHSAHKLRKYM